MRSRGANKSKGPVMKNTWVLLTVLPIAGFAQEGEDFFYFNDKHDEALFHIAYEEQGEFDSNHSDASAIVEKEEFDSEMLSLFESDLDLREDLPWDEEMTTEEITVYVEKKARHMTPDYDDVFAYDAPSLGEKKTFAPTSERVPDGNRHFFGRPKVVHAKPDPEAEDSAKKKSKGGRPIKRPPIADKKPRQPKTVAKQDIK